MREYKYKAKLYGESKYHIIKLHETETKEFILENYNLNSAENFYWAKEFYGEIFYSNDDIFNADKLDSTHLVIFMK